MMSGEILAHLLFDRGIFRVARQILPLPLILGVVVQFL